MQYEVTFIVDPVLSGDEIKSTAKTYEEMLKDLDCSIVHLDQMGLKQLAYPIKKRTSGIYYCIEFQSVTGAIIPKVELSLKRDERILRFLTVKLDKYGVKYNQDKRDGLIGSKKKAEAKEDDSKNASRKPAPAPKAEAKPAPKAEAKPAPAPVVESSEEE